MLMFPSPARSKYRRAALLRRPQPLSICNRFLVPHRLHFAETPHESDGFRQRFLGMRARLLRGASRNTTRSRDERVSFVHNKCSSVEGDVDVSETRTHAPSVATQPHISKVGGAVVCVSPLPDALPCTTLLLAAQGLSSYWSCKKLCGCGCGCGTDWLLVIARCFRKMKGFVSAPLGPSSHRRFCWRCPPPRWEKHIIYNTACHVRGWFPNYPSASLGHFRDVIGRGQAHLAFVSLARGMTHVRVNPRPRN